MDKNFLASLIGPFPMESPPIREGFYCVPIKGTPHFEMWFWDGSTWTDSDDGLGDRMDTSKAAGWYGKMQPGDIEADLPEPCDDGLGG